MILSLLLTLPLVLGMSFSDYTSIEGTEATDFSVDLCEGSGQGCSFLTCTNPDKKKFGISFCPGKQVPSKYGLKECIVQKISMGGGVVDGEAFGFYQNTNDKTYALVIFNATECDKKNVAAIVASAASGSCAMNLFSTGGKEYGGFIPNPVTKKEWQDSCRGDSGGGGEGGHMPGWAVALCIGVLLALVGAGAFYFVRSRRSRGYTAV